jgi:CubicO group peptidase (beta-lactamase class C family)
VADAPAAVATVRGGCEPRFARVREEFERNFAERGESGASVCVVVDGERVVDLWGGVADEATGAPWTSDTLNVVFSCSKGVAALAGHLCIDRGLLDPDAPVTRYWPEFGQAGKQDVPVRMLFNHQVGLPAWREPLPRGALMEWDDVVARLERSAPFWEPGTRTGYHAVTIGFLIGELVRRVTGRSIGTVVREEIAEPLGVDCWVGLPAEHEQRVARSIVQQIAVPKLPPWARRLVDPHRHPFRTLSWAAGTSPRLQAAVRAAVAARVDLSQTPEALVRRMSRLDPLVFSLLNIGDHLELADTREAHAAELPAIGAISNARGLAGVYAPLSLDGSIAGVRLVRPEAIARMRYLQSAPDVDAVGGIRTSYTLGFSKSWWNPHLPDSSVVIGEDAFGTPGLGGQMGFADPAHRLAFGYTCTRHGAGTALNARGQSLVDAVYETLGSPTRAPGFWVRPAR